MTTKPILDLTYVSDCPGNIGDWKGRHKNAVRGASQITFSTAWGHPVIGSIAAWCAYARIHADRFDSNIGDDYVLGPAWRDWGLALRTLLNGYLGPGADAGNTQPYPRRKPNPPRGTRFSPAPAH